MKKKLLFILFGVVLALAFLVFTRKTPEVTNITYNKSTDTLTGVTEEGNKITLTNVKTLLSAGGAEE